MEYKRAAGRDQEDEYLHKIIIAAATTLATACLKRVLEMFFVEQWRARVFLLLNLVLLAIFVSSIRSPSTEKEEVNDVENTIKNQEKKGRKDCANSTQDHPESEKYDFKKEDKPEGLEKGEVEEQEIRSCDLSKEELNERVEAFIARFRQHLVSDARKGKIHFNSRTKQAEMLNFHKGYKFTNSSGQLRSSTVPHRHSFCI